MQDPDIYSIPLSVLRVTKTNYNWINNIIVYNVNSTIPYPPVAFSAHCSSCYIISLNDLPTVIKFSRLVCMPYMQVNMQCMHEWNQAMHS